MKPTIEKINFAVDPWEGRIIRKIVKRAMAMAIGAGLTYEKLDATMDVTACHLNGMPLDLQRLLDADNFTFAHDVFGIRKHLDRATGKIGGHFLPRCHQRKWEA